MRVEWGVEDGYAGKARPHYIDVDDDEIADCETVDEVEQLIDSYVREEFESTISYYWDNSILDK